MAKSPTKAGSRLRPLLSSRMPKVNRGYPSIEDIPTMDKAIPINPAIKPFSGLSPLTVEISIKAKNVSPKYSSGPQSTANWAILGARKNSAMKEKRPPKKELTMPIPKAFPACPFTAIGCPSNVVAMDDAVPGMLRRMAEIKPPEQDPMYKPISMPSNKQAIAATRSFFG